MSNKSTSQLIEDLNNVPNIISSLGLGIAEAQKVFNYEYLLGIEKLLAVAKSLHAEDSGANYQDILNNIIKAMAPPRYQFTETSLTVKLDLAQSLQRGESGELGVSLGAITVNAAYTQGFAYDYRAAAEIRTVIHAINFDENIMSALLSRAGELSDSVLTLSKRSKNEKEYMNKSTQLLKKLTDKEALKIEVEGEGESNDNNPK